jgi:hypothetical protein
MSVPSSVQKAAVALASSLLKVSVNLFTESASEGSAFGPSASATPEERSSARSGNDIVLVIVMGFSPARWIPCPPVRVAAGLPAHGSRGG